MMLLRAVEAAGMYVVRVIVSKVTTAMTRIEKSAACTDSWPTKPLIVQAVPGQSTRSWRYIAPEMVLFRVFMNSECSRQLSYFI